MILETEGIYLDERKTPLDVPPFITGWKVVRNYEQFKDMLVYYLKTYGKMPITISLGHDLSKEQRDYKMTVPLGTHIDYSKFKEKSGMHCAKLLTEVMSAYPDFGDVKYLSTHSENRMGANNIMIWITEWRKTQGRTEVSFPMNYRYTFDNKEKVNAE